MDLKVARQALSHVTDTETLDLFAAQYPKLPPTAFKTLPSESVQLSWLSRPAAYINHLAAYSASTKVLERILSKAKRPKVLLALATNPNLTEPMVSEVLSFFFEHPSAEALAALRENFPVLTADFIMKTPFKGEYPRNFAREAIRALSVVSDPPHLEAAFRVANSYGSSPYDGADSFLVTIFEWFCREGSALQARDLLKLRERILERQPSYSPSSVQVYPFLAQAVFATGDLELISELANSDYHLQRDAVEYCSSVQDEDSVMMLLASMGEKKVLDRYDLSQALRCWKGPLPKRLTEFGFAHELGGTTDFQYHGFTSDAALVVLEHLPEYQYFPPSVIKSVEDRPALWGKLSKLESRVLHRLSGQVELSELEEMISSGVSERVVGVLASNMELTGASASVLYAAARCAWSFYNDTLLAFTPDQVQVLLESRTGLTSNMWTLLLSREDLGEVHDLVFGRAPLELAWRWMRAHAKDESFRCEVGKLLPLRPPSEQVTLAKYAAKSEACWFPTLLCGVEGALPELAPSAWMGTLVEKLQAQFGADLPLWEQALALAPSWSGTLDDLVAAAKTL